jgi:hypothetical protein
VLGDDDLVDELEVGGFLSDLGDVDPAMLSADGALARAAGAGSAEERAIEAAAWRERGRLRMMCRLRAPWLSIDSGGVRVRGAALVLGMRIHVLETTLCGGVRRAGCGTEMLLRA